MNKRNQVFQEILDIISEGGQLIDEWMENPHALWRRIRGTIPSEKWDKIFKDTRKKRALQCIQKKKWIEDRKKGNEVLFILSDDAVVEYLANAILSSSQNTQTYETLIVFDIPEAARKARQRFRRLLKKFGFQQIQLSVWSSMSDVGQQIRSLITVLGIKQWVKVYNATLMN